VLESPVVYPPGSGVETPRKFNRRSVVNADTERGEISIRHYVRENE
jgi:hypothetical protein